MFWKWCFSEIAGEGFGSHKQWNCCLTCLYACQSTVWSLAVFLIDDPRQKLFLKPVASHPMPPEMWPLDEAETVYPRCIKLFWQVLLHGDLTVLCNAMQWMLANQIYIYVMYNIYFLMIHFMTLKNLMVNAPSYFSYWDIFSYRPCLKSVYDKERVLYKTWMSIGFAPVNQNFFCVFCLFSNCTFLFICSLRAIYSAVKFVFWK